MPGTLKQRCPELNCRAEAEFKPMINQGFIRHTLFWRALKDLPVGEEARYSAEFTPKEIRFYTIYAYLYDGWRKIGHKTDSIYAQKT
jgi:hypothetical protein